MRPAIATVIGPGWEPRLVEHARASGLARLVGRCCDFAGLEDIAARADAIFIGSETHWLRNADLRHLASITRLVGVATDGPGARLLDRAGVHDVVDATTTPSGMLTIALADRDRPGQMIEVTGPRGAPGRSEVALALAYSARGDGGVTLIEADRTAPSLGLRMALVPSRERTRHRADGLVLHPAPVGLETEPLADMITLTERSRVSNAVTLVDSGPNSTWHRLVELDAVVFVGEATDVGVVRLARLCEAWLGPTPLLVLNRHRTDQDIRRVIRATGLEPVAVIPEITMPPSGSEPCHQMRKPLRSILGQRAAL